MKAAARSSNRVNSNYSTDSKDSGDSAEKKSSSDSPVIELNQTVSIMNTCVFLVFKCAC